MKRILNTEIARFFLKYAGMMAIPVYIVFTFISYSHNTGINPLEHWLSDYGNPLVNPGGAVFYNTGCSITAILLAVFYIGMFRWYRRDRAARKFNISFIIAQISGLAGSAFLILTTVFPLGAQTELHSAFSMANMIAMSNFLAFTATGFLLSRKIHKSIGIFGFLAAGFNIVTMNAFVDLFVAEWVYFLLFMCYMVLVTINYERLQTGDGKPVTERNS